MSSYTDGLLQQMIVLLEDMIVAVEGISAPGRAARSLEAPVAAVAEVAPIPETFVSRLTKQLRPRSFKFWRR